MIEAKIIADSINPKNCRLTTFVVKFPRIVLAEFNTHRALSKNSASSRAISFKRMLEMVKTDPFIPIRFQKDHKGMQGNEYFEGQDHKDCVRDWLNARNKAVEAATNFTHPVTKQIRNRLLEPFMWHTVIVSGTDFQNFFALRAHKDAEIHICELAHKMLAAYNRSDPVSLLSGQWHIPFGENIDENRIKAEFNIGDPKDLEQYKAKIAIARCARVSYLNFEGKDDYRADVAMCEKLFGSIPRHLSPCEHIAQSIDGDFHCGNFQGFRQFRKLFPDENLNDSRVFDKFFSVK